MASSSEIVDSLPEAPHQPETFSGFGKKKRSFQEAGFVLDPGCTTATGTVFFVTFAARL